MTTSDAIAAFWGWWPGAAPGFAASFESGEHSDPLIAEMSEKVKAIDDRLDWEFGPGREANHHLCLSGRGDPELRVVTERWLERAPAPDETWEYRGARQAHPEGGLRLSIAGVDANLDDTRFELEVEEERARIAVTGWHPAFTELEDQGVRRQILFITLDSLLGEDDVERWLARVSLADEPIEQGATPAELREAVQELAAQPDDEKWQMLRGEGDGRPLLAVVNRSVKRVDHWLKDTLLRVRVKLTTANDDGMPSREESELLNDAEDALLESLEAHAVYIARETHAGARTLFFHAEESGPAVDIASRWKPSADHEVTVEAARDVGWDVLHRWG